MELEKVREQILNFWHVIEFLNQNGFPKVEKSKSKKYTAIGHCMNEKLDIFKQADQDYFTMKNLPLKSDKYEVCMGKISRDECVRAIYKIAGASDERIENTKGSIAIMGLQVSNIKHYIQGSFNISPIIWMIYKMQQGHNVNLYNLINEDAYNRDLQEIENRLMKQEIVDMNILHQCYDEVMKCFVDSACSVRNLEGYFIYQRFSDDTTKEKYDEVLGYSNLYMNFFSQDLNLVKELNQKHLLSKNTYGNSFIEPYITSAMEVNDNSRDTARTNVLKDSDESRKILESVLNINNAPLGKWPSKYAPVFMQQFAVNLSIADNAAFPSFLSVNGPPGTGKTTMLKEIVADSIVKKAIEMCKYENANDAFTECNYEEGNAIHNGYNKFYSHYYKLDKQISKYSILVASSNNAAVENITRELPDGEALCNSLKNKNNKNENEISLNEICNSFNVQEEDIYYTKYANQFFNKQEDKEKDEDHYYWGLISVPLGNKKNQGDFTYLLSTIFKEMLAKNEYIKDHKEKYDSAKVLFQKQLVLVNDIKKSLVKACNAKHDLEQYKEQQKLNIEKMEAAIAKNIKQIRSTEKDTSIEKDKKQEFITILNRLDSEIDGEKKSVESKEQMLLDYQKKEHDLKEKLSFLESTRSMKDTILAVFRVETLKNKEIKSLHIDVNKVVDDIEEARSVLQNQQFKYTEKQTECTQFHKKIKNQDIILQKMKREIEDLNKACSEVSVEIERCNKQYSDAEQTYQLWIKKMESQKEDFDSFTILNDDYFNNIYDLDHDNHLHAHLNNPWVSNRYHREREKLFYYALQVNKEFILSSTSARSNIKNLLLMWTGIENNEPVNFKECDKYNAFPHLYHTLSVMIPVISSTFASIGRFLKHIKDPYQLGTLIIDEAGQAQPQMALGTMIRCRKAIIVGDPKQVEPVVTDELDAVKRLLKNEYTIAYLDKRLSVQQFADSLNPYGTYFQDIDDHMTWVGCPLIVHRRCINPMFDISNEISYNGIMLQQTQTPDKELEKTFSLSFSQWIQCSGTENNHTNKDHYVSEQGEKALAIIKNAFEKANGEKPSLYVITPFKSVESGIKQAVKNADFYKPNDKSYKEWLDKNIGTVHTFQGKEANEVIFLLGCDQDAKNAIRWVNANIVNVAVTRAKYRLCIIGDYTIWKQNKFLKTAKSTIDSYILKKLDDLRECEQTEENKKLIKLLLQRIPSSTDYVNEKDEKDDEDDAIDTYSFMKIFRKSGFKIDKLSEREVNEYGLTNQDIQELSTSVKSHLMTGIKIYGLIECFSSLLGFDIYDHSFRNIMFCKAAELHMRKNFIPVFREQFHENCIGRTKIMKAKDKDFTLKAMALFLKSKHEDLAKLFNDNQYNTNWWNQYAEQLVEAGELRNICCHPESFTLEQEEELRDILFHKQAFKNMKLGKRLIK